LTVRWADAIRSSKCGRAIRQSDVATEPNVLLIDPKSKRDVPKAFYVPPGADYAWKRVRLKLASNYDDWEPVAPRSAVDWLAKLG
jgi:hypothetical protein